MNVTTNKPIPTLKTCVYVGERMEEHTVNTDWGNSTHAEVDEKFAPISPSAKMESISENSKTEYMGDME